MSTEQLSVFEEDPLETRPVKEWIYIHGPSFLSTIAFVCLLVWTQVGIPPQTPQSICVFPSPVRDSFVWIIGPIALLLVGLNIWSVVKRNRYLKGKESTYIPTSFSFISSLSIILLTLSTLANSLNYHLIPMTQREGWILHECNVLVMIRFGLIYALFLMNAFIPMFNSR